VKSAEKTVKIIIPAHLLAVFFGLAAVAIATGYGYYHSQKKQIRAQQGQYLDAVTDLKIQQLADWRQERLKDAESIIANRFAIEPIHAWLQDGAPDDERCSMLLKWLEGLRFGSVYDAAYLLDSNGRSVAHSTENSTACQRSPKELFSPFRRGRRPGLIDFYRDQNSRPHLNLVVPLIPQLNMMQASSATLILNINPERTLYPLVRTWPGNSRTAETMLGRYESGQVLYLNDLRMRTNAAVNLRMPSNDNDLPMSRAAQGFQGMMEGRDYRGMPVLAAIRRVPDSPWLVVTKIDREELYAPLRERIWSIAIISTILLIMLISWITFAWRRQAMHFRLMGHQRTEAILREGQALLEQLVDERTEKLLQTNQQLLGEIDVRLSAESEMRSTAERLSLIFNSVKDAIFIHDAVGKVIRVNAQMLALYDVSEQDALRMSILEDFSGPDNPLSDMAEVWQKVLAGEIMTFEWQAKRPSDGHLFPVEVSLTRMQYNQDVYVLATVRDMTVQKLYEQQQQLTATAFETGEEGVVITDAYTVILKVNRRFSEITGYSALEVYGKPIRLLQSGRHDAAFYERMWHTLNTEGSWQGEIWNRRKNGEIYPEWLSISVVNDAAGMVSHYIAMFSDITHKKETEELIWKQANFDTLTGLPNRRTFLDRLRHALKQHQAANRPLALMFLDIDYFQELNDTLGHDMGDQLLKEAAYRLKNLSEKRGSVARLGGDEFAILLDDPGDYGVIEQAAQEIMHCLAEPYQLGLEIVHITTSMGITIYPVDADTAEVLVSNADHALYAAKKDGRNRFNYFTPAMQKAAQKWLQMANDLRLALPEGQLEVHYQPIVDLATGETRKVEALTRWHHPQHGLISPTEFIPIAEDIGLIVEIGDWVFREAAAQLLRWRRLLHPDFQVSINRSPAQFGAKLSHQEDWPSYLNTLGLPGNSVVVEITEGMLLDTGEHVVKQLRHLHNSGIQTSLDDFGTGYSSLSYLRKLDIDYLKIDQSFVRNLTSDSDDMTMCQAIIVMAHKLGIVVIAEGIETVEQRDLLSSAGCDFGQGYFFSRPLPPNNLEAMLTEQLSFPCSNNHNLT